MTTSFRETVTKFLHTAEALAHSEVGLFESEGAGKVLPIHPLHFFVWVKTLAPLEKELSQALFGPDLYKMNELLDELGCDWEYDELGFFDEESGDGHDPHFFVYFNDGEVTVEISRYMHEHVNISFKVVTSRDYFSGKPSSCVSVIDWMLSRDEDGSIQSKFTCDYTSPENTYFGVHVDEGLIKVRNIEEGVSYFSAPIDNSQSPTEMKVTNYNQGCSDSTISAMSSLISTFNATW